MKTSELIGTALDWAVAKCEGHLDTNRVVVDYKYMNGEEPVRWEPMRDMYYSSRYSPPTNWSQGGPIIERERIQISPGLPHDEHKWSALKYDHIFDDGLECFQGGDTPLIAAMRCYVASRLGDEVEVPEELK